MARTKRLHMSKNSVDVYCRHRPLLAYHRRFGRERVRGVLRACDDTRRKKYAYDVDEQVCGLETELLAGMTSLVKGAAAARRAVKKA